MTIPTQRTAPSDAKTTIEVRTAYRRALDAAIEEMRERCARECDGMAEANSEEAVRRGKALGRERAAKDMRCATLWATYHTANELAARIRALPPVEPGGAVVTELTEAQAEMLRLVDGADRPKEVQVDTEVVKELLRRHLLGLAITPAGRRALSGQDGGREP